RTTSSTARVVRRVTLLFGGALDVAEVDAAVQLDARQDGQDADVQRALARDGWNKGRAQEGVLRRDRPRRGRSCRRKTAPAPREGTIKGAGGYALVARSTPFPWCRVLTHAKGAGPRARKRKRSHLCNLSLGL